MNTNGAAAYLSALLNGSSPMEAEVVFTGVANLHKRRLKKQDMERRPDNYPVRKVLSKMLGVIPPTKVSNTLKKCQLLATEALAAKDTWTLRDIRLTREALQEAGVSASSRVRWIRTKLDDKKKYKKEVHTPIGTIGVCKSSGGDISIYLS